MKTGGKKARISNNVGQIQKVWYMQNYNFAYKILHIILHIKTGEERLQQKKIFGITMVKDFPKTAEHQQTRVQED